MSPTQLPETSTTRSIKRQRLGAIAAAVAVALVVWLIARYGAGIPLRTPAFSATQVPSSLNFGFVIITSLIAAALGWGLLAVLERTANRPRRVWTITAAVVLLLSLSMPLSGHGISSTNKFSLLCMHLAVGIVLIVLLGRTATPIRQP